MNSDMNLYREYLFEEEKFLKNLDRNLQDQMNRIKVEEISIRKLIQVVVDGTQGKGRYENFNPI